MPASSQLMRGRVAGALLAMLLLSVIFLSACIPANVMPPVIGGAPSTARPAPGTHIVPEGPTAAVPVGTVAAGPVVTETSSVSPTAVHIAIPLVGSAVTSTATAPAIASAPTVVATPARATPNASAATVPTPSHLIILSAPRQGARVASPVAVAGHVSVTPFEATLRGRVYDGAGRVVGEQAIHVDAEMGQPGDFAGSIAYESPLGGQARVEVTEISPKDGAVIAQAVAGVLIDVQRGGVIEFPAADERLTLPVHLLARLGAPGQKVTVALRWHNGVVLSDTFTLLKGEDGRGLLIGSLNWQTEGVPPQPDNRDGTLDIRNAAGTLIVREKVQVLRPDDQLAVPIKLYWIAGDQVTRTEARVPKTKAIGTAALEQLLWGPPPGNLAGFTTAIPTPQEVLSFRGRGKGWGPRVSLLDLTIRNGVALADFSPEMAAYGGDAARHALIVAQITQTLKQFSSVRAVRITVAGVSSW
jgi:hypothetical protein